MNKLLTITTSAVLGCFLAAQAQQLTAVRVPLTEYRPRPTIFNPQNPYEQIGQLHNEGLTEIGNTLDGKSTAVTPEGLYQRSGQFLESRQVITGFSTSYEQNVTQVRQTLSERTTDPILLLQRAGMTSTGALYARQAIEALQNPAIQSVDALSERLKQLESQVMSDGQLSKDDKDVLLASLAIGRYSIDYWNTLMANNPAAFGLPAGMSATELYAKASKVAEADVKGGLRGGYTGGITGGIVGGPAGIAGGIVGGVITGALFGSAAAYFIR